MVLLKRVLLLGVYIAAPDFWKLSDEKSGRWGVMERGVFMGLPQAWFRAICPVPKLPGIFVEGSIPCV